MIMTIEQWAEENEINCETFKIIEGKNHKWLEWTEKIGILKIKKRRKIHADRYNMDWWIVDIQNGQERWYYLTYFNLDGIKKYDFFDNIEELEERGDL